MGLTADLVRARVRGATIQPSRLDPESADVQALAERVCEVFAAAAEAGSRLGEVLAELEDVVADGGQAKLGRGLVRIAQDRCTTEITGDLDPAALRMEAFLEAVRSTPKEAVSGEVLARVAAAHGTTSEVVAEALYADLPSERRVDRFDIPDSAALGRAAWLVHRYNVALVQSLLVGAAQVRITLDSPSAPRMRQLVRWIKFNQLLHTSSRDASGRLVLVLDGPVSMFGPSTRYGSNLARLFPALLLQDGPWKMEATVAWTKARLMKQLVVDRDDGYVTHYADTGAYRTKVQEHFAGRFAEKEREWTLVEGELPVTLGPREVLFPDFTLRGPRGEVHLEIVGYWRPDALQERLEAIERYGPQNLLIAVPRKLRSAKTGELPDHPRIVPFADVLSVPKVLEAAEKFVLPPPVTKPDRLRKRPADKP